MSGKKPRKILPGKWVDNSKKTVLKNKIQDKQEERNRNIERQHLVHIPLANGLSSQRLPAPQQGIPMVLLPDGKGGYQPHLAQMPTMMPNSFLPQQQYGSVLQPSRFMVAPQMAAMEKDEQKIAQVHIAGPGMMFSQPTQQMFVSSQGFMQNPIMTIPTMPPGMVQNPMMMSYGAVPQMSHFPQMQPVQRISSMQTLPSLSSISSFSIPQDFQRMQPSIYQANDS